METCPSWESCPVILTVTLRFQFNITVVICIMRTLRRLVSVSLPWRWVRWQISGYNLNISCYQSPIFLLEAIGHPLNWEFSKWNCSYRNWVFTSDIWRRLIPKYDRKLIKPFYWQIESLEQTGRWQIYLLIVKINWVCAMRSVYVWFQMW